MKFTTKLTTGIAAASAAALGVGLLAFAPGVGADFTSGATATANISVGTFGCELEARTDGTVTPVIGTDANGNSTATISLGELSSSAGGTAYGHVVLKSTGSIPVLASWTVSTSGDLPASEFQPRSAPPTMVLQQGQGVDLNGGFIWGNLNNGDLGKSGSVTYTAHCAEQTALNRAGFNDFNSHDGGTVTFDSTGAVMAAPWTGQGTVGAAALGVTSATNATSLPTDPPKFISTAWTNNGQPQLNISLAGSDNVRVGYFYGYPAQNGSEWGPTVTWHATTGVGGASISTWTDITTYLQDHPNLHVQKAEIVYYNTAATPSGTTTITCFSYGTSTFGTGC